MSKITCTSRHWILGNKDLETTKAELVHKGLGSLKFLRWLFLIGWGVLCCFGEVLFVVLCCFLGFCSILDIKSG